MSKPTVAAVKPTPAELKAGEEYYYCTCGKSANQPFCDGSHKGTEFTPKAFVAEEDGEAWFANASSPAMRHSATDRMPRCPVIKWGQSSLWNETTQRMPCPRRLPPPKNRMWS